MPKKLQARDFSNEILSEALIFFFIRKNKLTELEKLDYSTFNLEVRDETACTPIVLATKFSKLEVVNILLKAKPDINAADHNQDTPIMWAAYNKRPDILAALLKNKPDLNKQNKSGQTATYLAALNCHKCLKLLIEAGADLNIPETDGFTPLMAAAYRKKFECVETLIKHKADPSLKNKKDKTAKDLAADMPIWNLINKAEDNYEKVMEDQLKVVKKEKEDIVKKEVPKTTSERSFFSRLFQKTTPPPSTAEQVTLLGELFEENVDDLDLVENKKSPSGVRF